MCSEGNLKIIGDTCRKRHEIFSDICLSIMVFRCSSAAGTHGPVIFIIRGTVVPRKRNYKEVTAYLRGPVFL